MRSVFVRVRCPVLVNVDVDVSLLRSERTLPSAQGSQSWYKWMNDDPEDF